MIKKWGAGLAILFPIVGLLVWCATIQLSFLSAKEYRVRIEGYDPRDLLSGHYMRFQFSFARGVDCSKPEGALGEGREVCVCLYTNSADSRFIEGNDLKSCSSASQECPLYIAGACRYGRFSTGLEQYYIPDELAPSLAVLPSDSNVSIRLSREGKGLITGLFVGEERVESYARAKMDVVKEP